MIINLQFIRTSDFHLRIEGSKGLDVALGVAVPGQLPVVLLHVLLHGLPDAAAVAALSDGPGELVVEAGVLGEQHPVHILHVLACKCGDTSESNIARHLIEYFYKLPILNQ